MSSRNQWGPQFCAWVCPDVPSRECLALRLVIAISKFCISNQASFELHYFFSKYFLYKQDKEFFSVGLKTVSVFFTTPQTKVHSPHKYHGVQKGLRWIYSKKSFIQYFLSSSRTENGSACFYWTPMPFECNFFHFRVKSPPKSIKFRIFKKFLNWTNLPNMS